MIDPRDALPDPRDEHYCMAHLVLREYAFAQPSRLIEALQLDDGALMDELWQAARGQAMRMGPVADHWNGAEEVFGYPLGDSWKEGAIIMLPQPRGPTECFFVAVKLQPLRYLTLELAENQGRWFTMFCEWQRGREWSHLNYGEGPAPRLADFAARVQSISR